ncbi:MAG: hypothetical protein MPJ50_07490 [Pirellulales bacterium]|nr:hypothetical protein [Pirellulales bacterium]
MPELTDMLRLGGILLIVFFLFRMQTRRNRNTRSTDATEFKQGSEAARHKTAHVDLRAGNLLELEMQAASRDAIAEVQTQAAILQRLIVDANLAAQRLETAMKDAKSAEKSSVL